MLSRWLTQCSPILLPFPAIITHFNPTQPWRQSSAGTLSAGFRMSGVSVQSTRKDTGMCTKAVTAFYCCQCCRLSSPQKSQLAHCGCLICNNTEWLLYPPTFNCFRIRILDLQKTWQGMQICDSKKLKYSKVQCTTLLDKTLQCNCNSYCFYQADWWWDLGFMDPNNKSRKCPSFVVSELWEQINRKLLREVQL